MIGVRLSSKTQCLYELHLVQKVRNGMGYMKPLWKRGSQPGDNICLNMYQPETSAVWAYFQSVITGDNVLGLCITCIQRHDLGEARFKWRLQLWRRPHRLANYLGLRLLYIGSHPSLRICLPTNLGANTLNICI